MSFFRKKKRARTVRSETEVQQNQAKRKRYSLPNARIIIHQPFGGFKGQASDIAIQAKEILRMRENINNILTKHTHQSEEKIRADIERDFIMAPDQAKDYGIIDAIISRRNQSK